MLLVTVGFFIMFLILTSAGIFIFRKKEVKYNTAIGTFFVGMGIFLLIIDIIFILD
ncbi:hypothetical protein [Mesobacillus selenatarsenatis]|uniref:hypothetical protein n=1 Tax=Mesobacillus selenatarsenatis TaxID=388741 RepID=UPI000A649E62|nr:hypothetical protein [Mesobacillus selenatarsenatis]